MGSFKGFPDGKTRFTPVPAAFFSELLPEIDHLGEMKVTLYFLWRIDRMEGAFHYLRRVDFLADQRFVQGLADTPPQAEALLDEGLERAVARGTLLKAAYHPEGIETLLYFLNSPKGRTAQKAIQRGEWRLPEQEHPPVELAPEPPNIFRLYEEHIGPLTPMIAEALRDAEQTYPADWIEEAIRISVENNKRSWRYAAAILNRWQQEGRHDRKDRQDTEKARRRYLEWENQNPSESKR